MFNKRDLPAVIVTLAMIISSIWLLLTVMNGNAEYGDAVRLLTIAFVICTFVMVAGCIVRWYGFTQEELESMGDIKR